MSFDLSKVIGEYVDKEVANQISIKESILNNEIYQLRENNFSLNSKLRTANRRIKELQDE